MFLPSRGACCRADEQDTDIERPVPINISADCNICDHRPDPGAHIPVKITNRYLPKATNAAGWVHFCPCRVVGEQRRLHAAFIAGYGR
ncbi:hypothetical protein CBL_11645 [Carabus blaptoides fortunei]